MVVLYKIEEFVLIVPVKMCCFKNQLHILYESLHQIKYFVPFERSVVSKEMQTIQRFLHLFKPNNKKRKLYYNFRKVQVRL